MAEQIGLLLIEDSPDDEALICSELLRDGFEFREFLRVENEHNFRSALSQWKWDVIISDYQLPQFSGLEALKIFKTMSRDIPFVLVSGTIGEEEAILALKNGASDYLLKDRLKKLAPTVRRELTEAKRRRISADTEEKLRHLQKLEAIGRLAGGVAHDFNNILTIITMYCDLLTTNLGPNNPAIQHVNEIFKATETASALTKHLLAFSHKQVLDKRNTDVGLLIEKITHMLSRLVGDNITIETQIAKNLPLCHIDASQIETAVMNLVINARDAIEQDGLIRIEVSLQDVDEDLATREGVSAGKHVVVTVKDNGSGMDQYVLSRLFEPFFTTKGVNGTGLGLSSTFGTVKQSGGFMTVESELGVGTTFRIFLPALALDPCLNQDTEDTNPLRNTAALKVLLVEDQTSLRQAIRSVLEKEGFDVVSASSSTEALSLIQENKADFTLIVTDVMMPGADGIAVSDTAKEQGFEGQILFISGYLDPANPRYSSLLDSDTFLQKPFSAEALLQKVKELLG